MYVDGFGRRVPSPDMENDHIWMAARAWIVTVLKEMYVGSLLLKESQSADSPASDIQQLFGRWNAEWMH